VIDGELTGRGGDHLPTRALVASEQLKETLGVDLPAMLRRLSGEAGEPSLPTKPKRLPPKGALPTPTG